jgi:hypothetical protein
MLEGEQSQNSTPCSLSSSCTSPALKFRFHIKLANNITWKKRPRNQSYLPDSSTESVCLSVSVLSYFVDARGSQLAPTSTSYRVILAHGYGESGLASHFKFTPRY